MPFSRHWIMHIEASLRIKNKILHSCFTRKRDLKKRPCEWNGPGMFKMIRIQR